MEADMNLISIWLKVFSPFGVAHPYFSTFIAAFFGAVIFGGTWWILIHQSKDKPTIEYIQQGNGGKGGSASVGGNGVAIGGAGGGSGPGGRGGDGGSGYVAGDGFAIGGEGGEAGQADRGGRGGRGPDEIMNTPEIKALHDAWMQEQLKKIQDNNKKK